MDARVTDLAIVATATVPAVAVFDAPDAAQPARTLPNPIPSGGPLVLLVQQSAPGWYQVELPVAPSGSTGWVHASDVAITRHSYRIEVHLSQLQLDVFNDGKLVRTVPIGIGTNVTLTPGTRFYTVELREPGAEKGSLGVYAYGLSGWSNSLQPFTGGPGQLGIHGAIDTSSIGTRDGAGCIRLRADDIAGLVSILPLGVPVDIVA
jgi:lipoprotein-anchoring transpeptidase ErfK/SrfK